jgi:NADH-quinone oxidoreductase subunit J
MQIIHFFLLFFLLLSSIFVIISTNSVHSVLFLILAFCNASAILFLFNADFLALVFIIIYVGAVAVLFLFIIMMLNVKTIKFSFNYFPIILFFLIFLILQLLFFLEKTFFGIDSLNLPFFGISSLINIDTFYSINIIGQGLFNYFWSCVLIAGFILLIAMIGAIILTLKFSSKRKNELNYRQLSRSETFLSFFH